MIAVSRGFHGHCKCKHDKHRAEKVNREYQVRQVISLSVEYLQQQREQR